MAEVYCPRCKGRVDFIVESERSGDSIKRIKYYYKCKVCGFRQNVSDIEIMRDNGSIKITIKNLKTEEGSKGSSVS
jgi:C4-type Zn-finger protein